MRELRLTDAELQKLLVPALKKRLAEEGFEFGAPESHDRGLMMLPVFLDLAECVVISRGDDGVWTFQQVDPVQGSRFCDALEDHIDLKVTGHC